MLDLRIPMITYSDQVNPPPAFLDQMRILTIKEVADMFGLDLLGLIQFIENCPAAIPTLTIGDLVAFDRNPFSKWYGEQ